jgi:hypothetical protein
MGCHHCNFTGVQGMAPCRYCGYKKVDYARNLQESKALGAAGYRIGAGLMDGTIWLFTNRYMSYFWSTMSGCIHR